MKVNFDRDTVGAAALAAGGAIGIYVVCRYFFARRPPPAPIPLSCHCGAVQGEVRASSPLRVICYCDDCQNFSSWVLAKNPSTAEVLHPVDAFGGTDILQVFRSDITITSGAEHLRIVKVKADTHTLRVFADCCASPLFNTRKASPIVGFIASALRPGGADVLPPARFRIMSKFAKGSPPGASEGVPLGLMMSILGKVTFNWRKKYPSPVDLDADYTVADIVSDAQIANGPVSDNEFKVE